jgi:hypothetical protein
MYEKNGHSNSNVRNGGGVSSGKQDHISYYHERELPDAF